MTPMLSALHVFPIKSCAALAPAEAVVEPRGLVGDRRWMVVDEDGGLLSARKHPRMTLVRTHEVDGGVSVEAPGMPGLVVRPHADATARRTATVWGSTVDARAAESQADAWISDVLGRPAHFAYMDEAAHRPVDPAFGRDGDIVSFADGFPLLLISQAALDALNAKLAAPVPMLRFRPNLVVAGTDPHAEDGWRRVRIGGIAFDVVKPCARCVLTTVDFTRGELDPGGEPLRTLIGYRRSPDGVTFGQNLIPRGTGTLRVGDAVEVLEHA
ncbi:MOSC domain-containing protein [Dokdonella sp. MW10]|uniref:MOSC domain-containing protein n=1 Tax=Dokdonella sp. MW10 TaxID=2992926 RepID=UPI003F8106A1